MYKGDPLSGSELANISIFSFSVEIDQGVIQMINLSRGWHFKSYQD